MVKKTIIVVGAGGFVPPPNENRRITNPVDGSTVFGVLPAMNLSGVGMVPAAPVVLKEGMHRGVHNGFGVRHAWAGHFPSCATLADAELAVGQYVLATIVRGSTIYWQGGDKCAVLRSQTALVVVQLKADENNAPYYSVVTALDKKQTHGTVAGTVG